MLMIQKNKLYHNQGYLCCCENLPIGKYTISLAYCKELGKAVPYIEEKKLFIGKDFKLGRKGDNGFKPVDTYVFILKDMVRDKGALILYVNG